jgi:carbon-monoxide dehydrogenase large subunit
MAGSLIGTSVRRVEDPQLLVGAGTFVGNAGATACHVAFVRSTVAHGRITSIDTEEAAAAPGVVAVFTAEDLGVAPFHSFVVLNPRCARPPLATDKVRFVGEPVVAVVAETAAAAEDAAELVAVDYEPLPAVVDPEKALSPAAPLQFEELGSNLAAGSRHAVGGDGPLAGAATVVRLRMVNQRIAVVPMEPNVILAVPGDDGDGHDLTVRVSTQMPHGFATSLSRILDIDIDRLRVVAPHVGGGFGGKAGVAAEHAVAAAAARLTGRPVLWAEGRGDNLIGMHGRSQVDYVEMGFDDTGRISGLQLHVVGDAGAYAGFGGALPLGPTRMMAQGVYEIPAVSYDVAVALTNTSPVGAFRGAGRPEAAAFLERVMDLAAATLGVDPVELRRRNLIGSDAFPYTTRMGTTYDCGDYRRALDEAVRLAGYDELRAEQAVRRERGDRVVLGIGVSTYVEVTAGGGGREYGAVTIDDDGGATIRVGTSGHGQGHATSFSMLVADRLGIPLDRIRFVQSDTAAVPRGGGTGGSRSLQIGGNAVAAAAEEVWDRARKLAADELEADPADIVATDDGRIAVAGVPARALTWADLAGAARRLDPEGAPLAAEVDFSQAGATFPFGAHVSVVEVDTDTGAVRPVRHVAVDDCGRVLNPLIVTGQQHGGIAQGMAQALWEEVLYDLDGNPVTATLADYGMPSAAEIPSLEATTIETPTPLNPLGAKGIGESGTIGSMPAVHNAVIDALSHLGVRHIDMPCTPERVWRAIAESAANGGHQPDGRVWAPPPAFFADLPLAGATERPDAADVDI